MLDFYIFECKLKKLIVTDHSNTQHLNTHLVSTLRCIRVISKFASFVYANGPESQRLSDHMSSFYLVLLHDVLLSLVYSPLQLLDRQLC